MISYDFICLISKNILNLQLLFGMPLYFLGCNNISLFYRSGYEKSYSICAVNSYLYVGDSTNI